MGDSYSHACSSNCEQETHSVVPLVREHYQKHFIQNMKHHQTLFQQTFFCLLPAVLPIYLNKTVDLTHTLDNPKSSILSK